MIECSDTGKGMRVGQHVQVDKSVDWDPGIDNFHFSSPTYKHS